MDGNYVCLGSVGAIFLLVAIFMAVRAWKDWRQYRESEKWIPTTGQILVSNVTSHRGTKGGTSYKTFITYAYQVVGQRYQGNRFSFDMEGISYGSRSKAEEVAARYPAGSQVTLYYDPNDPSQAVLVRKYDFSGLILDVIFFAAGIGMIIVAYFGYLGYK